MKDTIESIIVLILIIVALFVVTSTRGSGNLDFNVKLDLNSAKETFAYDIVKDQNNGEYKNTKGNNMYIMFGKNSDGSYRAYFIHVGAAAFGTDNKYVQLRLDNVQLDNEGQYSFVTENNVPLKLIVRNKEINVVSNMGTGDSSMEGQYIWRKDISRFAMDQFQIFPN